LWLPNFPPHPQFFEILSFFSPFYSIVFFFYRFAPFLVFRLVSTFTPCPPCEPVFLPPPEFLMLLFPFLDFISVPQYDHSFLPPPLALFFPPPRHMFFAVFSPCSRNPLLPHFWMPSTMRLAWGYLTPHYPSSVANPPCRFYSSVDLQGLT